MVITTKDKRIHFLSKCYVGKTHDYALLKNEFPPQEDWFSNHRVRVDSGYQGFAKDYECLEVIIPHKKPKNQELTEAQKEDNTKKSGKRIWVEHSIGGMKRYRFLSDRLRAHDIGLYNQILGICAGLWNFGLK
jgi:DDE superfamily endonuclease